MAAPSSKKSKTSRFPVARIKKIMQMDEEVGKLASGTPVMISKSIECFLQALLASAAEEAQKRGGRKLTAYHLKQTINTNETFDFLRDIVSTIPDPTEQEPSSSTPATGTGASAGPSKRKPRAPTQGKAGLGRSMTMAQGQEESTIPDVKPGHMPDVGTWKKDMEGEGGTGEGGRGMFDDYEDDEEDY